MSSADSTLTALITAAGDGDSTARERLWALIYDELRALAHRGSPARPGGALDTTVLVHEAYLRLFGREDGNANWKNRRHFFGAAAQAMRRIQIDEARRCAAQKRGGGRRETVRNDAGPHRAYAPPDGDPLDLLALDEALQRLETEAPRQAQVVLLRYFAGLGVEQIAELLEVSPRTVELDWRLARIWLYRELAPDP